MWISSYLSSITFSNGNCKLFDILTQQIQERRSDNEALQNRVIAFEREVNLYLNKMTRYKTWSQFVPNPFRPTVKLVLFRVLD